MTVEHVSWAWTQRAGDPMAKLVLILLSDRCDMDGNVDTSLLKVAHEAETSEQDVIDAVGRLRALSLLPGATVRDGRIYALFPTEERPAAVRPDKVGCAYVISDGTSTKIGVSVDITARLRGLKSAMPLDLTLRFTIRGSMTQMRKVERLALEELSAHRIAGEWVAVHPDEAIAALCRARDRVERGDP